MYSAILVALMATLQTVPRDQRAAAAGEPGTAVIGGRVLDKETGQPIARAVVILVRLIGPDGPQRRYTRSAEDGRFQFPKVAAGSYHLGADTGDERPTHLPQLAGVSGPSQREASTMPVNTVDVVDGEVRDDILLALSRALAVAGVVLNDLGEPLANVEVRAELIRGGRIVRRSPVRRTDDRGEFRLFGLPQGRYRVCALSPPPYLRTPVFPERLMTTCYPAATREHDAGLVVLRAGDEPQVQIRMQLGSLHTLSGTLLNASGAAAADGFVHVSTRNRLDVYGMTYRADANGRFTVPHLLPGEYDVQAHAVEPKQPANHKAEFAAETVNITGGDVDVVLAMSRTIRIAGQVVFDGGSAAVPSGQSDMSVLAIGTARAPRASAARVQSDLTFVLDELYGPQLLDIAGATEGWVLKTVRYAGADVTDTPTEFRPSGDSRHLQVTLTRRGAAVAGHVVDATGAALPGARVFLIPAEAQRWGRSQREPMTVSREAGAFAFDAVRPGQYLIVALSEDDAPEQPERDDYELLARLGERLMLAEGERQSVTLRIATLPEDR